MGVRIQHDLIIYKREWIKVTKAKGEAQELKREREEVQRRVNEVQGKFAEEEKPVVCVCVSVYVCVCVCVTHLICVTCME